MEGTNVIDMGGHWLFPVFFGFMTFIIGVVFVKYVFFSSNEPEKKEDDEK